MPYKNPLDNARWAYTAARYNQPFDLDAIAAELGYPLFMKPFDGGGWGGVTQIRDPDELHRAYDESGERLMHLQAVGRGYDVFARSLSIGAETMVMKFRPDQPMHDRYAVDHDFLTPEVGDEVVTISRLVNAFFRWEFNSCETLVRGAEVYPIDYANACPDVAVTSLHYYFPWAMTALVRWSVFCVVTGRRPQLDLDTRRYFEIADRDDLTYEEKLAAYRALADDYFDTERYQDFCATSLAHIDELVLRLGRVGRLRRLLVDTVRSTYPAHEHEQFIAHFRGLVGQWVDGDRWGLRSPGLAGGRRSVSSLPLSAAARGPGRRGPRPARPLLRPSKAIGAAKTNCQGRPLLRASRHAAARHRARTRSASVVRRATATGGLPAHGARRPRRTRLSARRSRFQGSDAGSAGRGSTTSSARRATRASVGRSRPRRRQIWRAARSVSTRACRRAARAPGRNVERFQVRVLPQRRAVVCMTSTTAGVTVTEPSTSTPAAPRRSARRGGQRQARGRCRSAWRLRAFVDRHVRRAERRERLALPARPAVLEPHPGQARHQVQLGGPRVPHLHGTRLDPAVDEGVVLAS